MINQKGYLILVVLLSSLTTFSASEAQSPIFKNSSSVSPFSGLVACENGVASQVKDSGQTKKLSLKALNNLIKKTQKQASQALTSSQKKTLTKLVKQYQSAIKCSKNKPASSKIIPLLSSTLPKGPNVHYSLINAPSNLFKFSLKGLNFNKATMIKVVIGTGSSAKTEFINSSCKSSTSCEILLSRYVNGKIKITASNSKEGHLVHSKNSINLTLISDDPPGTPDFNPDPSTSSSPSPSPSSSPSPGPSGNPSSSPGSSPTPSPSSSPSPSPSSIPSQGPTPPPPAPPSVGDHVATLEHDTVTGLNQFQADGSIPLPKGIITEAQIKAGISKLAIQNGSSNVQAQITGISKYSNDAVDGYDIVQLSWRATPQPGATNAFKVFLTNPVQNTAWPATNASAAAIVQAAPLSLHPAIRQLFQSNAIVAEAQDVFGHLYRCDMTQNEQGSAKIYSYGWSKIVIRVFCMTKPVTPVAGSTGTLPHLMGVTAYYTLSAGDEALRLSITVDNSIAGAPLHNGQAVATAMKKLYFKNLKIKFQGQFNWTPAWETTIPQLATYNGVHTTLNLMPDRSDGTMNVIHERRRVALEGSLHTISSIGTTQGQAIAQYRGLTFPKRGQSTTNSALTLYSAHNFYTARFGMTPGAPWPHLDYNLSAFKSSLTGNYNKIYNYFKTGKCDVLNQTINYTNNVNICTKATNRICNYPYLGSDTITPAIVPFVPHPQAPTDPNQCIADPNPPPAVVTPLSAPYPGPYGVAYGGMTGGSEIFMDGYGAETIATRSREGALQLLLHALSRNARNDQLTMLTGDPVSPLDALKTGPYGPYIPVQYFNSFQVYAGGTNPCPGTTCDQLFNFTNAPMHQINYVQGQNLKPDYEDAVAHQAEDQQHLVRLNAPLIATAHILNHPMIIDWIMQVGYNSYFSYPNIPQYYSGSGQANFQYGGNSLPAFHPGQPSVGSGAGRGFAHPMIALATATSMADTSFRTFIKPYHEYVARDVFYWTQMWHGLLNKGSNFNKLSPIGYCYTSVTRENAFLAIAASAIYHRLLETRSPTHADEMKTALLALSGSRVHPFVLGLHPGWTAPPVIVPLATQNLPNQIFTQISQIPAGCMTDVNNSGPTAGEDRLFIAIADIHQYNPAQWALLKASLHGKYPNPTTTLGKLQSISPYDMSNGEDRMNLGLCQVMELVSPGYCG